MILYCTAHPFTPAYIALLIPSPPLHQHPPEWRAQRRRPLALLLTLGVRELPLLLRPPLAQVVLHFVGKFALPTLSPLYLLVNK